MRFILPNKEFPYIYDVTLCLIVLEQYNEIYYQIKYNLGVDNYTFELQYWWFNPTNKILRVDILPTFPPLLKGIVVQINYKNCTSHKLE